MKGYFFILIYFIMGDVFSQPPMIVPSTNGVIDGFIYTKGICESPGGYVKAILDSRINSNSRNYFFSIQYPNPLTQTSGILSDSKFMSKYLREYFEPNEAKRIQGDLKLVPRDWNDKEVQECYTYILETAFVCQFIRDSKLEIEPSQVIAIPVDMDWSLGIRSICDDWKTDGRHWPTDAFFPYSINDSILLRYNRNWRKLGGQKYVSLVSGALSSVYKKVEPSGHHLDGGNVIIDDDFVILSRDILLNHKKFIRNDVREPDSEIDGNIFQRNRIDSDSLLINRIGGVLSQSLFNGKPIIWYGDSVLRSRTIDPRNDSKTMPAYHLDLCLSIIRLSSDSVCLLYGYTDTRFYRTLSNDQGDFVSKQNILFKQLADTVARQIEKLEACKVVMKPMPVYYKFERASYHIKSSINGLVDGRKFYYPFPSMSATNSPSTFKDDFKNIVSKPPNYGINFEPHPSAFEDRASFHCELLVTKRK